MIFSISYDFAVTSCDFLTFYMISQLSFFTVSFSIYRLKEQVQRKSRLECGIFHYTKNPFYLFFPKLIGLAGERPKGEFEKATIHLSLESTFPNGR
jgi:hypothetical protein